MRKLIVLFAVLFLAACGDDDVTINPEELESKIASALKEMGDNTNLEIIESETNEDGRYVITLSDKTFIFIEDNKATAANTLDAPEQDVKQSFELLIGTIDESLSMGDRNKLIQEVTQDEVVNKNDIQYTYQADDSILLQAEL